MTTANDNKRFLLATLLLWLLCFTATAQGHTFGMWYDVGVVKQLAKNWNAEASFQWRLTDGLAKTDRTVLNVNTNYKITPWLTAYGGYELFFDKRYVLDDDGSYLKRGQYTRHQFHIALQGVYATGRWRFSLRERWQYSYRPEQKNKERYDYELDDWDGTPILFHGSAQHTLRSRLQVEYNISGVPLRPYVSAELFNSIGIQKARYMAGVAWTASRRSTFNLRYFFEDVHRKSGGNYAYNNHIIWIAYRVRL